MKITKKIISMSVFNETDLKLYQSTSFVNTFFKILKNKSLSNKTVKIHNFGTFYEKVTSKRLGRNPKTKELYEIKSMNKILFKPSNKVKKNIN